MKKKVVGLVDSVHHSCRKLLEELGYEVQDFSSFDEKKCRLAIHDVEAIIVRSRFPFNATFLQENNHLKCIGRWGSGLENIDLDAAEKLGISVVNAPEGNRQAVAEHALLLLLSMMRHMPKFSDEVRKGIWKREENRGFELRGKKVGIIGYGNTGSAFARLLGGFNIEVLAYDAYRTNFSDAHIREVALSEILENADVISLHIPLTKETKGIADADFFSKIKRPVYFINTARGPLIDPEALLQALKKGSVIRAALDVLPFEKSSFEQLDQHPLLETFISHPDIVVSPHIAGWTHEANDKTADWLIHRMHDILCIPDVT
ncbi:MAG: hypothetical protein EA358_08000 [Flavobacteriales bacterium]|nr:MAG: hypothetical protein EA358_08000 [Flavobacteriales bacterium]